MSHLTPGGGRGLVSSSSSTFPVSALGPLGRNLPFWIRLAVPRARTAAGAERDEGGLTLRGLIDVVEPAAARRATCRDARSRQGRFGSACRAERVNRLRHRLIAAFLAATVLPFAATIWISTSLLDRSLGYATTGELDRLSRTLEATVRQLYQREREALKQDALTGRIDADHVRRVDVAGNWPEAVRAFWDSGEAERFGVSGSSGDHVDYMRRTASRRRPAARRRDLQPRPARHPDGAAVGRAAARRAPLVESMEGRDLRRGFTLTLLLLLGAAWLVSLAPLLFIAHRISQPIQQLTAGLTAFAAGDWSRRVDTGREPGTPRATRSALAVDAFNRMADQLRQNRERLVHLTQMASWQSLARKTAHELKNSLTPIRLTVEEMLARQPADRAFIDQAAQIVVSEIESLERRVRAFSEFCQRAER